MNTNMNEKGRQTRLLAAIAVLAMVVCAFAVVMPSEQADAADPVEVTPITGTISATTEEPYYVTGDVTVNASGTAVVIYIANNNTAITITNTASSSLTVYVANSYDSVNGTVIPVDGMSFTVKSTQTATFTNNNGVVTIPAASVTNITATCGVSVASVENTKYYAIDSNVSASVAATTDVVSVINGSATVSAYDSDSTLINQVVLTDVVSTSAVTVTGGTSQALTIAGGAADATGDITIPVGKASVTVAGLAGILNAYVDDKDVAANTIAALGNSSITTLSVYGNPAANQTVTASEKITVQAGSTATNLTITNGTNSATVTVTTTSSGKAEFTAAATVSLPKMDDSGTQIESMTLVSGSFTTGGEYTIPAGSTLTVANGSTLTLAGAINVNGNLYVAGTLSGTTTITVEGGGKFIALGGATIPTDKITVSGAGYIDFSGMAGTEDVSGTITGSRDYGQAQNVNVIGNWTVTNNSYVIIRGDFVINEKVTVTIKSGSQIVIVGDTSKMDISGTLNIEAGASFVVVKSENTEISGTVNNSGAFYVNEGNVEILGGGIVNSSGTTDDGYGYTLLPTITPTPDPTITLAAGITTIEGFEIASGASLNVYGDFNITAITNKGTITLDGATATAASTVTMTGNGAVVDIVSVEGITSKTTAINLTITDGTNNIVISDAKSPAGTSSYAISDIQFIESITKKDGLTTYAIDVSGAPAVSAASGVTIGTDVVPTITVTGTKVTVTENLAIDENITFVVGTTAPAASGVLEVSGTLTALDSSSSIAVVGSGSAITVTGMIQSRNPITVTSPGVVNAAHYTAKVENVTYNYYTSLATAIENGATPIDIMGTVKVIENMTIPAGTTVNAGSGLIIGDSDHRDIIVTVEDGATLNGTTVTVNATLEFEDKTDNYVNTINSDVSVIGDVSSSYTNIYTALLGASEGDVVTVTKPVSEGAVILTSDVTVPAGVTLEVPISRNIQVNDGVTLTVDGTMTTTALLTENGHGFSAVASENQARLIVNGTFMSMDTVDYDTYQAAGAYYGIEGSTYNYLTSVGIAAAIQNIANGVIGIYGDVTVADIQFNGTEEQSLTVTLEDGVMVAGTITLSRATFAVDSAAEFNGNIASAVGAIEVVNTCGITAVDAIDAEDGTETFSISGTPGKADANGANATVAVTTGNVSTTEGTTLSVTGLYEFSIDSGATLTVTGQNARLNASGFTVDGTLVATNYGRVIATNLTVMGTFTVEPATTELGAGSAQITNLYVGTTDKTEGNNAAAVNGTFTPSKAVVAAAATIDGNVIEALRNSTEIYVEGALYATAYASGSNTVVDLSKVSVTNADVDGWAETADGPALTATSGSTAYNLTQFNIGAYDDLYAVIDYNIYSVYVVAGNGIGTIAIDNVVLVKGSAYLGSNFYTTTEGLKAGTHTITYTLQTGYEGTSQITVNGVVQTGNTFECSGTDAADRITYINLSDVTPVDISTGGTSSDDGLGLTDYLLIILVVLIVVMAIMVALRLMRS